MPALAQTDPTAIKAFVEITQSVFVCFAVGNSAVTHPPTPGKTHFLKGAQRQAQQLGWRTPLSTRISRP